MKPEEFEVAPARLIDSSEPSGVLLREEKRAPDDRGRPFYQVLDVQRRRRLARPLLAAALAVAAASLLWLNVPRVQNLSIVAENVSASLEQPGAREAAEQEPSDAVASEAEAALVARGPDSASPAEQGSMRGTLKKRRTVSRLLAGRSSVSQVHPKGAVEAPTSVVNRATAIGDQAEADCAGLSRAAKYSEALRCYDLKAQGTGMGAELALLEAARLQRRALSRDEQALSTLNQYRARFSQGMLRREAELLRLEILVAQGRSQEARATIEVLLPLVAEMKLSLLRRAFELAWAEEDCEGARSYMERLQQGGMSTDDLAERLVSCGSDF